MRNPVVVLAVIAIIFGVFNIVLWLIIVKGSKETSSPSDDLQNLVSASEKRLTDTLTRLLTATARPGAADAKKIAAEVASALKISEVRGMKEAVEDIPHKLDEILQGLKNVTEELDKQRNFIEALDGHIVESERRG